MPIILSVVFWLALYSAVALLVAAYIPLSLIIRRRDFIDDCTNFWSKLILWFLKKILRIDYKISGIENIPNEPCIIACKHQSMWDTIIFHIIFHSPSYVYKKELLKVPIYGWYINKMPGIQIDRQGGGKALRDMIKRAKKLLLEGHNIVIFPQGTRTPPNASSENYPYQVGVAALYSSCNVKVVPVNLNSGEFWGKKMIIKKTGCIKLEFLKPIETGLNKDEFMQILEDRIENHKLT